jgi:ketosteroid isomerase-like protein
MSQENAEIVRRWWGEFNTDGLPPLSLCDEEIEIRNPPDFPVSGLFQGHEGVRRWRDQVFEVAEDPRVEVEELLDVPGDGEAVLMLLRTTATARYTQLEFALDWAAIWTIRNGKVLRAQGYMNPAEARQVAGIPE